MIPLYSIEYHVKDNTSSILVEPGPFSLPRAKMWIEAYLGHVFSESDWIGPDHFGVVRLPVSKFFGGGVYWITPLERNEA